MHDALARNIVAVNRGELVKSTGEDVRAVFGDPLDALPSCAALQTAIADPAATNGVRVHVRCGADARRPSARCRASHRLAGTRTYLRTTR